MHAVIFHNPRCSTSRNALALLREAGIEPQVVEYLQTPPTRERLAGLIAAAGLEVRDATRDKEAVYAELGLDDPMLDDTALLDAMVREPILIQRPFVETALGTRLARPLERVHEILPAQ
ncbi:MAG TPA: arsenate reductase (glutaredoxin) [Luteimonas sp.]